jgi:catecholate siderophore receptor
VSGGWVWRRGNTRVGSTDSLIDQLDLTARFETGRLKHSLAAGL